MEASEWRRGQGEGGEGRMSLLDVFPHGHSPMHTLPASKTSTEHVIGLSVSLKLVIRREVGSTEGAHYDGNVELIGDRTEGRMGSRGE